MINLENNNILNRHEKSLKYALDILKDKYKEYVDSIYLYGSYARKDHKYSSDVDLFICVREQTSARVIANMRSDVVNDDYTLPEVELMISKSGLKSPSNCFDKNLKKEAILLWENH